MITRIVLLCLFTLLTACQSVKTYQNSSVVDFLYPSGGRVAAKAQTAELLLPLRIGVAFTPSQTGPDTPLSEQTRFELMDKVSEHFRELDVVDTIQVIPSTYLRPGGGFRNLEQLQGMFDIDVVALVSYDQTSMTDEGLASIAYWTIVGAYVVPGEKNSTHTLLELVLYDIDSRQLLFRAPGTSTVKSNATLVNLSERRRKDSLKGFVLASEELIVNLESELDAFRQKIRSSPGRFKFVPRLASTQHSQ